MFRRRLSLAFAVLGVLVCLQAGLAYVGAKRVNDYAEHSRLTSDLLAELLEVSADKQRLRVWAAQQLMDAGAVPDIRERLVERMRDGVARLADLSRRHVDSWQRIAVRDGQAVPPEVLQLVDICALLQDNVAELEAQLRRLEPLSEQAEFSGVWQQLNQVFDTAHGRDLRELLNGAIDRQRTAVPIARTATEDGLDRLRDQALAVALVTAAAALVCAGWFGSRLKRPLERLLEGTRALQAGDLAHRIPLGSRDEFEDVARHFNAMAAELQQHRREADAARGRLEHAVQARTAELQEAHGALSRLDERRRQLFADLGHELRTPATAIRGEAEIALRGAGRSPADYREALARIVGGVKQLAGVIDDLLLIAHAEADELVMRPAPVDLPALLVEVAEQAEALGALRGVRVRVGASAAVELGVQADAERLRQAVMIVLDNAIRYSHEGGAVELTWSQADDRAQIVVRDAGIGIPADELPKVFERFYRGQRARGHRVDGTGIGLSIAEAIVKAHGGSIGLESSPGIGTVVRIALPLAAAVLQPPAATVNAGEAGLAARAPQGDGARARR